MYETKMFGSATLSHLETEVNQWLKDNRGIIEDPQFQQTVSASDKGWSATVMIFYRRKQ